VNGIFSATLAKAPYIALGDGLGSCVFNRLLIALLDFSYRETPFYFKAGQGPHLVGRFLNHRHRPRRIQLAVWWVAHVGLYTPAIIVLYIVAVRAIYLHERLRDNHSASGQLRRNGRRASDPSLLYCKLPWWPAALPWPYIGGGDGIGPIVCGHVTGGGGDIASRGRQLGRSRSAPSILPTATCSAATCSTSQSWGSTTWRTWTGHCA
jgi:hypothetical protein